MLTIVMVKKKLQYSKILEKSAIFGHFRPGKYWYLCLYFQMFEYIYETLIECTIGHVDDVQKVTGPWNKVIIKSQLIFFRYQKWPKSKKIQFPNYRG
jgi:hypothetical protein